MNERMDHIVWFSEFWGRHPLAGLWAVFTCWGSVGGVLTPPVVPQEDLPDHCYRGEAGD